MFVQSLKTFVSNVTVLAKFIIHCIFHVSKASYNNNVSQENQVSSQLQQNSEMRQDNLKTKIESAITDLEGDRDIVDFGKENKTIDLMSPPQAKSPTPKNTFTPKSPTPKTNFTPTKQVSCV